MHGLMDSHAQVSLHARDSYSVVYVTVSSVLAHTKDEDLLSRWQKRQTKNSVTARPCSNHAIWKLKPKHL